jgi:hypothetical protein
MTLVNDLCVAIGSETEDLAKARKLIEFGEKVSEEVLIRAGFMKLTLKSDWLPDRESFDANQLAQALDLPDYAPDDYIHRQTLTLYHVPTALNARNHDVGTKSIPIASEFIFCKRRVIVGDGIKVRQVMTYEEVARYIVFWFAEKILQIIRKNEWDRMRTMPDLYDRLAELWTPKQYGFVLVNVFPDDDDPEKFGDTEHYIGVIFAGSIHEAANKTGFRVLDGSTDEVVNLEGKRSEYRLRPAGLHPSINFEYM